MGRVKGREDPAWVTEAPELEPGDDFFLKAFFDLNTCRQLGFGGVGPIPWRDMILYAEVFSLTYEVRMAFLEILRVMDRAFLVWDEQRSKRNQGQGSGGRRPFGGRSKSGRRRG